MNFTAYLLHIFIHEKYLLNTNSTALSFLSFANYAIYLGIENIINFSFNQIYNGTKPFAEANNKLTKFDYYSNSILLFVRNTKNLSKSKQLQIEPYIMIAKTYKPCRGNSQQ